MASRSAAVKGGGGAVAVRSAESGKVWAPVLMVSFSHRQSLSIAAENKVRGGSTPRSGNSGNTQKIDYRT